MSDARYSIGIDLGTTHCALLSYVDTSVKRRREDHAGGAAHRPIDRRPAQFADLDLLPSFLYLPHPDELGSGDLHLPWTARAPASRSVNSRAAAARRTPIRLVSSAKSWLCHPGVDRRAAILPSDAPPEVARVSPLESSVRYLTHLREAWDHARPDAPLRSSRTSR